MSKKQRKGQRPQTLAALRRQLEERRRELVHEVRGRIQQVRSAHMGLRGAVDDYVPNDSQDDLDPLLVEITSGMLSKVETALRMIELGEYGICIECRSCINEKRRFALPFALRCTSWQEKDENRRPHRRAEGMLRGDERAVE